MHLPPLDHSHPDVIGDPYPIYRHYRETTPVHYVPISGEPLGARYILLRHADVAFGMQHRHMVRGVRSSQWDETRHPIPPEHLACARILREFVLFKDPPEHGRLRQPINRILKNAVTPDLRNWAAAESAVLVESLPDTGIVDVASDYAALLTSKLVGTLLGIGKGFSPLELDAATACIHMVLSNRYDPARMTEASAHMAQLEEAIQQRMDAPVHTGSDARLLESILSEMQMSGLPAHQTRSTAIMLLMAARDNVRSTIVNAVLTLLRHPPAWQILREDPGAIAAAVEEVLRFEPPVQFMSRHTAEEVEIAGVIIPAGIGVTFGLAAANRDPAVFTDPDRFDIHREAGPLASFGFGIHRCPGSILARILIEEALKALLQRWPAPQLAVPLNRLGWQKSMSFRVLTALPVKVG